MKGKIAFVLGAAVGYVLGTRAGRERYEQIKRGAESLWNTAPVQRGVGVVRDAAQVRVDQVKESVVRAGKGAVAAMLRDDSADAKRSTGASSAGGAGAKPASRESGTAAAKQSAAERRAAEISTPEPGASDEAGKTGTP